MRIHDKRSENCCPSSNFIDAETLHSAVCQDESADSPEVPGREIIPRQGIANCDAQVRVPSEAADFFVVV